MRADRDRRSIVTIAAWRQESEGGPPMLAYDDPLPGLLWMMTIVLWTSRMFAATWSFARLRVATEHIVRDEQMAAR